VYDGRGDAYTVCLTGTFGKGGGIGDEPPGPAKRRACSYTDTSASTLDGGAWPRECGAGDDDLARGWLENDVRRTRGGDGGSWDSLTGLDGDGEGDCRDIGRGKPEGRVGVGNNRPGVVGKPVNTAAGAGT
jgi:hypothetical protein